MHAIIPLSVGNIMRLATLEMYECTGRIRLHIIFSRNNNNNFRNRFLLHVLRYTACVPTKNGLAVGQGTQYTIKYIHCIKSHETRDRKSFQCLRVM